MLSTLAPHAVVTGAGELSGLQVRIQKDLERCGLAMGISRESLHQHQANGTLTEISKKATQFLERFWSVVPKKFQKTYKNPCWHANQTITDVLKDTFQMHMEDQRLVTTKHYRPELLYMLQPDNRRNSTLLCLPYFFLAGFSKCGTTTFYSILNHLKGVSRTELKELHWWGRGPLGEEGLSAEFYHHAVIMYLLNFFRANREIEEHNNIITFDASPSTLIKSNFFVNGVDYCAVPAVMSQALPNAKFIVLLRNPVERVYSHFFQLCTSARGPGSNIVYWPNDVRTNPAGHFHQMVVSDLGHFKRCLEQRSPFECVYAMKNQRTGCGGVGDKLTTGLYYFHLKKWLQFYPRKQFLFLRIEDFSTDPYRFISEITTFLGIHSITREQAEKFGSNHSNRRQIFGAGPNTELSMRNETKELLKEFYAPYNHLLADLIHDTHFLWNH